MPFDLDDLLTQVECPKCGAMINVPYRQMRIQKAAGCGCGALIKLTEETPIATARALLNEARPLRSEND